MKIIQAKTSGGDALLLYVNKGDSTKQLLQCLFKRFPDAEDSKAATLKVMKGIAEKIVHREVDMEDDLRALRETAIAEIGGSAVVAKAKGKAKAKAKPKAKSGPANKPAGSTDGVEEEAAAKLSASANSSGSKRHADEADASVGCVIAPSTPKRVRRLNSMIWDSLDPGNEDQVQRRPNLAADILSELRGLFRT